MPEARTAGQFSDAAAEKIVNVFAKAGDNAMALANLLLFDIEMSCKSMKALGDDEEMADHFLASLESLSEAYKSLPIGMLDEQIERTVAMAEGQGWAFGYRISDELDGFAAEWREQAGKG